MTCALHSKAPDIIRVSDSPPRVLRAPPTRSALSKGRPTLGLPAHVPGQDSRGRDAFHCPSSLISHDPPGSSPPPNAEPRPMSECTSLAPTSNPGPILPRGPSPPSLPVGCLCSVAFLGSAAFQMPSLTLPRYHCRASLHLLLSLPPHHRQGPCPIYPVCIRQATHCSA